MKVRDEYLNLTYDLSGSISKNRFRQELLWGLSKAIDKLDDENWYAVVFDYVCDIELHYDSELELYQVKVNKNQNHFTLTDLLKHKDNSNSIVGKLMIPLQESRVCMKGIIVTNRFLSNNGQVIDAYNEYNLDQIIKPDSPHYKKLIKELNVSSIDCSNLYFLHTELNLINPQNEIIGKLVRYFNETYSCEPKKPNSLYCMLYDEITKKACYEQEINSYDELIQKKALTKEGLINALKLYRDYSDDSIQDVHKWIEENISNIRQKTIYKRKTEELLISLNNDKTLKCLENEIIEKCKLNDDLLDGDINTVINNLDQIFGVKLDVYDKDFKYVFFIYMVKKIESGVCYE